MIFASLTLAIVIIAAVYFVDVRYVWKKPTPPVSLFLKTGFFPRRATAYVVVIVVVTAILASIRDTLPAEGGAHQALDYAVSALGLPLLVFAGLIVLSILRIAVVPSKGDDST